MVGIIGREDIELVILNKVDIVLQFQVIKYGKIAYIKDLLTKVLYDFKTMSFYMDSQYFRDVRNKIVHEKFLQLYHGVGEDSVKGYDNNHLFLNRYTRK